MSQCSRGLTPNPDLACNRHIKFDALLKFADQLGADKGALSPCQLAPAACLRVLSEPYHIAATLSVLSCAVATGHYARLAAEPQGVDAATADSGGDDGVQLLRGADSAKDQTYFLASVQPRALRRVLFPVGHLQVRVASC